jgi:hypothetical protein
MCLQCHGTPNKQISDNTFSEIQKLYPNDKAVGYDMNQVGAFGMFLLLNNNFNDE